MNSIFKKIRKAIEEKKQIKFRYEKPDDDKWGERIGNPHTIFISNNTDLGDHKKIDLVQISGVGSNDPNRLKQYVFDYIKDVEMLETTFEINQHYNPNAPSYEKKFVGVEK